MSARVIACVTCGGRIGAALARLGAVQCSHCRIEHGPYSHVSH